MPTTRKQKKARKSRGLEMLSDIENLDIMLGENHFERNERNESVNSNQPVGQEAYLEMNLEMRMRMVSQTREIMDQVQILN